MHHLSLVFACLFATVGGAGAVSPNPADLAIPSDLLAKANDLVEQLGSENFVEREEAQKELAGMGRFARPALVAGINTSPDAEVRFRCLELLPHATALDTKARLDTFLADTEGRYEHNLPAWNQFRAAVRNEWLLLGYVLHSDRSLDKPARQVFADLVTSPANRRMLMAYNRSRGELGQFTAGRRQDLYDQLYPRNGVAGHNPSLEDVAALLFAESRASGSFLPRTNSTTALMTASGFTTAVRKADEKGKVYRAIASAWLDSRTDAREMYQSLTVASNLDLPESACRMAARLLTSQGATALYRGRGASHLVSYGSKKHLPLLEKARGDTFGMYSVRITTVKDGQPEVKAYGVEVRDVALAVSVILSEQKLEDYGFADRYGGNAAYDGRSYTYTRYYFPDEAARKTAFAKWEKWRLANE